jgi:hypothetical protein
LSNNGFEPNIIAFCCHYCAYAAADLAGSMRLEYPTAVKIVNSANSRIRLARVRDAPMVCWWRVDWRAMSLPGR